MNPSLSRLFISITKRNYILNPLCWRSVLFTPFNTSPVNIQSKRSYRKNYDKKILLEPNDVEYRYGDSEFLSGPSWADEPFIQPTDEEIVELSSLKMEHELKNVKDSYEEIDPLSEPFRQVFESTDDGGHFTKVEIVKDENGELWKWVERLMPVQVLPPLPNKENSLIPPLPEKPPEGASYYVDRTRSRLYPIYLEYKVMGRDHKTYWRNRWDGLVNKYHMDILDKLDQIKWENNEKTIMVTTIRRVHGDIWQFVEDLQEFLKNRHQDKQVILTSVHELNGFVEIQGDFVRDVTDFFRLKNF